MGLPARRIHQQISVLASLYRLADAAGVAGGLSLAIWLVGSAQGDYLLPGAAAIIVHYLVAEVGGMYRSWRGVSGNREAFATLATWLVAFTTLGGIGFASGRLIEFPRSMLGIWILTTALLLIVSHSLLRSGQRSLWLRGLNTQGCAIVGGTELGIQL